MMIVVLFIGITLALAFACLRGIWLSVRSSLRPSWHRASASLALAMFTYLYGPWIYLTIYAKYIFAGLFLAVLFAGLLLKQSVNCRQSTVRIIFNLSFALLFGTLSVLYFTGTTGRAPEVELEFPMKTGRYFVLQGGKGLPTNYFHYSYRGAIYAMDIVRLNKLGARANSTFSKKLQDYYIFADTVFSPCAGIIARARDENPDNIPPNRKRGPSNTNQLLIKTDDFYVFMSHLKQYAVFVKEGDAVRRGQPLALVGNSGFSLEPHLHIQAHRNTGKANWYEEEPLYIVFDGRAYLMFEVISPKRVDMMDK